MFAPAHLAIYSICFEYSYLTAHSKTFDYLVSKKNRNIKNIIFDNIRNFRILAHPYIKFILVKLPKQHSTQVIDVGTYVDSEASLCSNRKTIF